jgi:hypothetical protein
MKHDAIRLTTLLDDIGWPQTVLAARLGCGYRTIQRWLDGTSPMPPDVERWLIAMREAVLTAERQHKPSWDASARKTEWQRATGMPTEAGR